MFTPPVAKERTKATASSSSELAAQRSTPVSGPSGVGLAAWAHMLQRSIGNQATQQVLAQQGTSFCGNDPLEHEADSVADQVMRIPGPEFSVPSATARLSREYATSAGGKSQSEPPRPVPAGSAVPSVVREVLSTPGQPLDAATREYFEPRFGYDFSRVRLHADSAAAESAEAVNAFAYTVGSHLVFARQRYAPHSREGQALLAHELAHVVQQSPIIARQQKPAEQSAEAQGEEPARDKWKGTPVSQIVISLARSRAGFRIPQGMLLGTVRTDLAPGTYQITPVIEQQKWIIEGPGVKAGLRFSVDLSESNADPWTLSYPGKLTLLVSAGARAEPKTFGEAIDPSTMKEKDPLWVYEGWGGNTGPPEPVAGIDDYETIELDKQSVTPTAENPRPASPLYRVKYRDKSERTLSYAELTPKMRTQLRPLFQKADEEFLMFTLQTFPMWWSVVSITPLAPMPKAGARPYIPKRVPLVPAEPTVGAGAAMLEEAVVVPVMIKAQGPGVAYGQQAAARLAQQGKTGPAILRPLTDELNAQANMTPMEKATAMQSACNAQKSFGAGPIATMPNNDLVVTSRAPLPNAPVIIVKADGTVLRGTADIALVDNNTAFKVSNVRAAP